MDLDELRSVRRTERQKDSLQHLQDSFYEDVAAYIAERKAERRRAADAAADPFGDPEVGQLTDEIGTAEDVVEAVYERRVGKVVKLASFAAADMSADKTGLTAEERDLFDDLVERIKRNRRTVLDTLAGEAGDASGPDVTAPGPTDVGEEAPTDGPPTSEGVGAADADATPLDPGTSGADAADTTAAENDRPESGTEPPVSDDPPAPDDVLAAAMGGDETPSAARAGSGTDTDAEAGARTDAERNPVPPEAVDDPATSTDRERDVAAADGAETDGGAAAAGDVTDPSPAGGPSPRDTGDDVGPRGTGDAAGNGSATPHCDRVTLRITTDVGRIYGVDEREYDLESEDVVRLPATNAGPLVDRGAAERLE